MPENDAEQHQPGPPSPPPPSFPWRKGLLWGVILFLATSGILLALFRGEAGGALLFSTGVFLTYLVGLALGILGEQSSQESAPPPPPTRRPGLRQSLSRLTQWTLTGLILALAAFLLAYHVIQRGHLEQTALLFVGVPALFAVILTLTPRARSVTGIIVKGITIALLLSGMVLGEGVICILMAAPLFYGIGIGIGLVIDFARRRNATRSTIIRINVLILLAALPLSLEGVHDRLSFPRRERVAVTRTVAGAPEAVTAALARPLPLDRPLPLYLRLGFPAPRRATGSGLAPGDRRVIHFAGGEGRPGDLVLEVAESRPGRVRFRMVGDESYIAHWLAWETAEVAWREIAPGRTRVTWTVTYRRLLDPAWYFGPWERYAVGLAAEYLIEAAATPPPKG